MPEYEQTILDVVKSAIRDGQDLVRGEIALAKSELRGELKRMAAGAGALAAAAVMAVVALVFLFATVAWAAERHLPLTVDTMKENAKWIRARTS